MYILYIPQITTMSKFIPDKYSCFFPFQDAKKYGNCKNTNSACGGHISRRTKWNESIQSALQGHKMAFRDIKNAFKHIKHIKVKLVPKSNQGFICD